MNHKLIAIFAIICATSITVSYGLKCFQCEWSSVDGVGDDDCEKDPPSSLSTACKNPLNPDDDTINWACTKTDWKVGDNRMITRGCIDKSLVGDAYKNDCEEEDGMTICLCDKDSCNSGINLNAGLLLPAILLLSKLFIF